MLTDSEIRHQSVEYTVYFKDLRSSNDDDRHSLLLCLYCVYNKTNLYFSGTLKAVAISILIIHSSHTIPRCSWIQHVSSFIKDCATCNLERTDVVLVR